MQQPHYTRRTLSCSPGSRAGQRPRPRPTRTVHGHVVLGFGEGLCDHSDTLFSPRLLLPLAHHRCQHGGVRVVIAAFLVARRQPVVLIFGRQPVVLIPRRVAALLQPSAAGLILRAMRERRLWASRSEPSSRRPTAASQGVPGSPANPRRRHAAHL